VPRSRSPTTVPFGMRLRWLDSPSTNREGSAEMGVSISLRLPYELLLAGGGGRAKGFGGPVAPALRREFADGEGER
jgi:hypothetical protein